MNEQNHSEARAAKFDRQTSEAFEQLGRFVQAFERIVHSLRSNIVGLIANGTKQQVLLQVLLNLPMMTASPLFTAFRSLTSQVVKDSNSGHDQESREFVEVLLKQFGTEFEEILSTRNKLIHGTWSIGWAGADDEDFSRLSVHKLQPTKLGLESATLPQSTGELTLLVARCSEFDRCLKAFGSAITMPGTVGSPHKNFEQHSDGKWHALKNWH